MLRIHRIPLLALAALALAITPRLAAQAVADPAANPEAEYDDYDEYAPVEVFDPFEGFNRAIFKFNDVTYAYVLKPAVTGYEFVVRPPVNRAIGNFYDNVRYPVRLLNALLQGKISRAGLETKKFAINTTVGVAGFFRPTDDMPELARLPREDFGQTLGVWGVPHGPYLVIPIFGGASLRDGAGRVADTVVSPTGWEYIDIANREWTDRLDWEWKTAITVTDTMSSLPGALDLYEQMKNSAVDPYLSVRDATRRYRDRETAR
jgi:phospholipid-binding lipoprotein MlaA